MDPLDEEILALLAEGPKTPYQLAQQLEVDRGLVRERLGDLRQQRFVISIPRSKRILFFLVTGEVLTRETYDRIMKIIADLREILDRYRGRFEDPDLAGELEEYLGELAEQPDLMERADRILAFLEELLDALADRSGVTARNLVGLRPLAARWRLTERGAEALEKARLEGGTPSSPAAI